MVGMVRFFVFAALAAIAGVSLEMGGYGACLYATLGCLYILVNKEEK